MFYHPPVECSVKSLTHRIFLPAACNAGMLVIISSSYAVFLALACCVCSISVVVSIAVTPHELAIVVTVKTTLGGSFI